MGPNPMTGVFIKRGNLDPKTDMHRGTNAVKRHREKTIYNPKRGLEQICPSEPSRKNQPCQHLDFGPPPEL